MESNNEFLLSLECSKVLKNKQNLKLDNFILKKMMFFVPDHNIIYWQKSEVLTCVYILVYSQSFKWIQKSLRYASKVRFRANFFHFHTIFKFVLKNNGSKLKNMVLFFDMTSISDPKPNQFLNCWNKNIFFQVVQSLKVIIKRQNTKMAIFWKWSCPICVNFKVSWFLLKLFSHMFRSSRGDKSSLRYAKFDFWVTKNENECTLFIVRNGFTALTNYLSLSLNIYRFCLILSLWVQY